MMKKIILFVFCTLISLEFYGQESCNEALRTLILDKISAYPSDQLVPYYSKEENFGGILIENQVRS